MKTGVAALLLIAGALAHPAVAQSGKPADDPLSKLFFPPELVLRHASDIKLQLEQRKAIVDAVKEMQGTLFELQMQLQEQNQELMKVLGAGAEQRDEALRRMGMAAQAVRDRAQVQAKLDEARVLTEMDKLLEVERVMKRRQMQLLIKIRNSLTPEQQELLNEFRKHGPPPPDRPEGLPF